MTLEHRGCQEVQSSSAPLSFLVGWWGEEQLCSQTQQVVSHVVTYYNAMILHALQCP